jgi:hypothetical protein
MMWILIQLYLLQIVMVCAYWVVSTYINDKKAFATKKDFKQWLIPFYLPFMRAKKGFKKFLFQIRMGSGS